MTEKKKEFPNWYEIPVKLTTSLEKWIASLDQSKLRKIDPPHITILYGFDPAKYPEIDKIVKSFNITEKDYSFGDVRDIRQRTNTSKSRLLFVRSPKLQRLFWTLYELFPNRHSLTMGRFYDPHITLAIYK